MQNPFEIGYYKSDELRAMGFAEVGKNVSIAKNCSIHGLQNISLGDNVRIDGFCTITAGKEPVRIGAWIHIGSACLLSGDSGITMEDFSGLSHGVKIFTNSDDFSGNHLTNPMIPARFRKVHSGPVILRKHVLIGAGSIVLPDVTIETGAAIGALSLVRKNIPAWTIFAGNPAKRIGTRSQDLLTLEQALLKEEKS